MIIKCFNCGGRIGKSNLTIEQLYQSTVGRKKSLLCNKSRCKLQFPTPQKVGNIRYITNLHKAFEKWYKKNESPNQRIRIQK